METYTYIYIVIRNILTKVTMNFGGVNTGFGNNALGNPLNGGQGKGGGGGAFSPFQVCLGVLLLE